MDIDPKVTENLKKENKIYRVNLNVNILWRRENQTFIMMKYLSN